MPIILHGHQVSQPSRSVLWYADYAKKDVEVRYVNLIEKEHKSDEYLKKFPAGQVPAMEDGDLYLEESAAILQYLAEGDPIVPKEKRQAARVNQMLAWHLAAARKITFNTVRIVMYTPPETHEATLEKSVEMLAPVLSSYNSVLEKSKFLAGDDISLADFLFAPEVDQLFFFKERLKVDFLEPYPAIRDYLTRLEEVPGYTKNVETCVKFLTSL